MKHFELTEKHFFFLLNLFQKSSLLTIATMGGAANEYLHPGWVIQHIGFINSAFILLILTLVFQCGYKWAKKKRGNDSLKGFLNS